MGSPTTISVDDGTIDGVVQIAPALALGSLRRYIILGRSDAASDMLALSVGTRKFTFDEAALWIAAGERLIFTPDNVLWPLVSQGIYGICDTGITITLNVQIG